jgi:NADH-quinone oxidoreductase subunit L
VTAGLTAFYTFRAYYRTFYGEERIPEEAGHHAHESPPVMTVPLIILAVFAVGVGFVVGPVMPESLRLTHFLAHTPGLEAGGHAGLDWLMMGLSGLIALAGIGLAWWMYVRQPALPAEVAERAPLLYQASLNKFYFDDLYERFVVKRFEGLSVFSRAFDNGVIDALVDLVGHVPVFLGKLFRPVQNGLVQFYALAMVLGLTVFLLALVARAL